MKRAKKNEGRLQGAFSPFAERVDVIVHMTRSGENRREIAEIRLLKQMAGIADAKPTLDRTT